MERKIIWTDPACKVTEHFTVRDCLWLGKWARLANGGDGLTFALKSSLIETCEIAEQIRFAIRCPMTVTSMYRPTSYAPLVGSGPKSPHCFGLAMDFTTEPGMEIEEAKKIIRPLLDELQIRMERGTTTWIHIDRRTPGPSGREFSP